MGFFSSKLSHFVPTLKLRRLSFQKSIAAARRLLTRLVATGNWLVSADFKLHKNGIHVLIGGGVK